MVKFPYGAVTSEALTATGAQAITVNNDMTLIDGVTVPATGNRTINLTIGDKLEAGARLLVQSKTAATETTIFGTSITSATITGVAGKTKNQEFVYNGTAFVATGAPQQID